MTLRDLILRYRAKKNLTQQEMADKVGISRATIIKVESGETISPLFEQKIRLVIEEDS